MKFIGSLALWTAVLLMLGSGCGVNETEAPGATAGNAATGGAPGTGGASATGGASGTGGASAMGGAVGIEGAGDSGGSGGDLFALRLDGGLHSGSVSFDGEDFLPLLPYLESGQASDSLEAGLQYPIADTPYDELYQRETYVTGSPAVFSIPVPDGDYTVHLHFVDWYANTSEPGERVFDVDIEGSRVLSDFDIVSEAGKNTALVKSFDVTSTGGALTITLTNEVFYAEIAAVEIVSPEQPYLGEGMEDPGTGGAGGGGTGGAGGSGGTGGTGGAAGTGGVAGTGGAVGGIVQVTLEQLWDDTHLPHDARPVISPYGYGQMQGPTHHSLAPIGAGQEITPWAEIEECADYGLTDASVGCSEPGHGISASTNTVVEKGHSYLYARIDGVWSLVKKSDETWIGQNQPLNDLIRPVGTYGCGYQWRAPHGPGCYFGPSPDGFDTFMPGWTTQMERNEGSYQHPLDSPTGRWVVPSDNVDMACHVAYYRLIKKDPAGPDDRSQSCFLTHMSMDVYDQGSNTWDRGISRYKRVTNDWVANTLTTHADGLTKQQFLQAYAGLEPLLPTQP